MPMVKFSLNIPLNAEILQFSFVGMRTQEVAIGNQTVINVTLEEVTFGVEEIVVVGYGIQRRSDITGSISSVKTQNLSLNTSPTVAHMLAGKATGLTANLYSAQPGGAINLQIRGAATNRSPLIIVDGFPITGFYGTKNGLLQ
jgi:hypothetical protein